MQVKKKNLDVFLKKMSIFSYKNFFGEFFFRKKCAGARAGAKAGVRVRALHTIKMCELCMRVLSKIHAH